jgi:hypothetical protein
LDIDLSEFPGVDKWIKRIGERSAVQAAKKVGSSWSEEQMKEMIGGMKAKMDAKKGGEGEEESSKI